MTTEVNPIQFTQGNESVVLSPTKAWHFDFSVIDDPARLQESFALRYEVYCRERQFLALDDYPSGFEIDDYDGRAIHVSGINQDGLMVGTVRLVVQSAKGFPLLEHCELFPQFSHLADDASHLNTAEISRLAISKLYRRRKNDGFYGFDANTDSDIATDRQNVDSAAIDQTPQRRTKPEIVLGLYKAMYQASKRQGITHWFAAMEKSLLRLLRRYNIDFNPIGPELDYYGPVVPYIAAIADIESAVYLNCPEMYVQFIQGLEPDLIPNFEGKVA